MSAQGIAVSRPELPVSLEELGRLSPILLLGGGAVELAHELLRRLLGRSPGDARVVVADSANALDAYSLVRDIPRHMAPSLLARVRVSRAFTWQQQLALLEREAPLEAARHRTRWLLALGPLDLLADSDVKPHDACAAARRTARALAKLSAEGFCVVAAQEERMLEKSGRAGLLEGLRATSRNTVLVERRPGAPSVPVRRR